MPIAVLADPLATHLPPIELGRRDAQPVNQMRGTLALPRHSVQFAAMSGKKKPPRVDPEQISSAERLRPEQLLQADGLLPTTGVAIELEKLNKVASLLWLPQHLEPKERNARIMTALDLFESLKPTDGLEAMLAVQMVGTHTAASECLRRAMLPEQSYEGRQAALSQAQKLMNLYLQQVAALDRHRGKGQQRITVERLNVNAGGQAVVGDVNAAPRAAPHSRTNAAADGAAPPAALPAADPQLDNLPPARKRSKTPR